MPRISVVVPIYDVEPYLEDCLRSIARQTLRDLEVVMVDDGSPDESAAIGQRFADADPRFRLLRQPNAGLGAARNAGAAACGGEYLAFVDSDDRLVPDAYERLLASLVTTGSDFATGGVRRFDDDGEWPAQFLRKAFLRQRLRTHVSRFDFLLVDRMAPNKLWRRSFWDAERLRFPEGVLHEDIPVVVPAHFLARCVDVIKHPVYLYRERNDGLSSITSRRTDPRTLRDRVAAVEQVDDFLAARGTRRSRDRYQRSVVGEDLRYHLDVFDRCTPPAQALFLALAARFLDRCRDDVADELPPIQRLKWHLVRAGRVEELVEVLRFQRDELARNPRAWSWGRAYGDYPFRGDAELAIPGSVYRMDTTRRRARHVVTLTRPTVLGVVPRRGPARPGPAAPALADVAVEPS
jgi:CDP-glycerol glycerophosphotransferase